jgi:hypothetical protein
MIENVKRETFHSCSDCVFTKKVVVDKVAEEDISVYETIMTGISTAQVAKDPRILGDDVSVEKMTAFFNAAMEKEAHYKKLEIEWWRKMLSKYNISSNTKIDVINAQFYVCLDQNGKERIDFEPKKALKSIKV